MSKSVEKLRNSRNKAQVAYHKFALSTRSNPLSLFCFFEGKDNPYYVPRIKRFTDSYCPIKCGGKQAVLDVYRLITNKDEYKKYKLAFFVDRDFNKPIKNKSNKPPIFETPCYSVENLYVSTEVFKEILINEFHLSETTDKAFNVLIKLYKDRQKEFHNCVLLFNSWYACLIEKRERDNIPKGIILEDRFPAGFIEVSLEKVACDYDFEKLYSQFPNATKVEYSDVEKKMNVFKGKDMQKVFRGKYELEFLIQILRKILLDSKGDQNIVTKKINFNFGDASSIGQKQAINIFEAYAETPPSLLKYLETVTKQKE